jgi:hypothetical protein
VQPSVAPRVLTGESKYRFLHHVAPRRLNLSPFVYSHTCVRSHVSGVSFEVSICAQNRMLAYPARHFEFISLIGSCFSRLGCLASLCHVLCACAVYCFAHLNFHCYFTCALFAGRPSTPPSRIEASKFTLAGSLLRQLSKLCCVALSLRRARANSDSDSSRAGGCMSRGAPARQIISPF